MNESSFGHLLSLSLILTTEISISEETITRQSRESFLLNLLLCSMLMSNLSLRLFALSFVLTCAYFASEDHAHAYFMNEQPLVFYAKIQYEIGTDFLHKDVKT